MWQPFFFGYGFNSCAVSIVAYAFKLWAGSIDGCVFKLCTGNVDAYDFRFWAVKIGALLPNFALSAKTAPEGHFS
ncbi:MAG: hypothetical protein ACOX78_07345 [Lachnospiraceae bacterium]